MLIGLHGASRAGKDAVAARLVERHGFTQRVLADSIRAILYDLNPVLPFPGVDGLHGWEWLAALVEGEGTIVFYGKSSVRIAIGMSDEDVVLCAQRVAQCGLVSLIKPEQRNRPEGQPKDRKPMWYWRTQKADEVEHVLTNIRPWMGTRRGAKIDAALERLVRVDRRRTGRPRNCAVPSLAELVDRHGWEWVKDQYPESVQLMIRLGQSARRHIDQDVWLWALEADENFDPEEGLTVISDCRQMNEVQFVRMYGGEMWLVTRPGTVDRGMDNLLKGVEFEVTIRNDGTLDELDAMVDVAMRDRS